MIDTCTVSVSAKTTYLNEQSQPEKNRFAFAYTITIENHSDEAAQLLNRHWFITDSNNQIQEVKGTGVVGQQPRILPGDSFSYSSAAVLETQAGTMEGNYEMQNDNGEIFNVPIPAFALTRPQSLH